MPLCVKCKCEAEIQPPPPPFSGTNSVDGRCDRCGFSEDISVNDNQTDVEVEQFVNRLRTLADALAEGDVKVDSFNHFSSVNWFPQGNLDGGWASDGERMALKCKRNGESYEIKIRSGRFSK